MIAEQVNVIYENFWRTDEVLGGDQVFSFNFQKVKKEDLGNYRPVSFISIQHKVLE